MTKSVKKLDAQGKSRVLTRAQSGELTCTEGQVEDMLSAGESTEEERIRPPQLSGQKRLTRHTLAAMRKR